jgi:hypothetical protein
MRRISFLAIAFLVVAGFSWQTASAQFPKLPKIPKPNQTKPQPTPTTSAEPTATNDAPTARQPEAQSTSSAAKRVYDDLSPTNKPVFVKDSTGASTFPNAHQLSVPIVRLNEFLPDTQEIGRGVVVGQGKPLFTSRRAFSAGALLGSGWILASSASRVETLAARSID